MRKIVILIFLFRTALSISQSYKDNYFPPTPEVSALIKTVDIPINYSTGGVTYSIPIHNITLKDLTIPISLSYQSTGFKPSEIASNVGLGWEINAGGKITQNVIGQNDINVPGPTNDYWNLPNDRDFKVPKSSLYLGVNPYHDLDSLRSPGTDLHLFDQINNFQLEVQPDIFYYSTPVNSGKFFFASNFETKQVPFGKEKILYNSTNNNFEIIDIKGIRYLYEIRTENINTTINQCNSIPELNGIFNSSSYTYHLSKIITPSNEIVEFIYDTIKYNLINDKDYTRYYQSFYGGTEKTTSYVSNITNKVLVKIKVNQKDEVEFLYNKFRKDIKGFQQEFAPKTLDAIKIKYDNEISSYQFNYGYFGIDENAYNEDVFESTITNEDSNYRLKLKSFQKNGENPYIFLYFNESNIQRYTTCLDHWGYYNNSCNKFTYNSLFGDSTGASKDPYLLRSQSNILKNITLPTMGIIDFSYELNDCYDCDISYPVYFWNNIATVYSNNDDTFSNDWQIVEEYFTMPDNFISTPFVQFNINSNPPLTTDNNAIGKIYDDQNNLISFETIGSGYQSKPFVGNYHLQKGKTYKLVLECKDNFENQNKFISIRVIMSNNNSSTINKVGGLRVQNIKMKDENDLKYYKSYEYKIDNHSSGKLYEKPSYFDEYTRPFIYDTDDVLEWSLSGYVVQYSRLPIDLFGYEGSHIYYEKITEKRYDVQNSSNEIKTEKYFTFFDDLRWGDNTFYSKIAYNWKRGLLSQTNEFNSNSIVRKTNYFYKFLDTPVGISNISVEEVGNHIDNPTFPNEFHKRSLAINPIKININFYNLYSYKSTKLISAWYYLDKKTIEENLNGNILRSEEIYKYDNPINAQLTSVISTISSGDSIETKYSYAHEMNNQAMIAKNMIGIPLKTETFKNGEKISTQETVYKNWGNNLLAPEIIRTAKGNLPVEDRIKYTIVDNTNGNPIEIEQVGGIKIIYIWGYNKTQPIAKIENATYAQVQPYEANLQTLSNGADEQGLIAALSDLRNALPNAMVTTYTYKPLVGISTVTDPKGDKQTYHYDSFNRLQFVKDAQENILSENQYHYRTQN